MDASPLFEPDRRERTPDRAKFEPTRTHTKETTPPPDDGEGREARRGQTLALQRVPALELGVPAARPVCEKSDSIGASNDPLSEVRAGRREDLARILHTRTYTFMLRRRLRQIAFAGPLLGSLCLGAVPSAVAEPQANSPQAPASAAAPARHPVRWSTVHFQGDTALASLEGGGEAELTLDRELQEATRTLLRRARPVAGAATLIDAETAEVLAMVELGSTPEGSLLFDPIAPAASLFKIVTTAALLERSHVTPHQEVCYRGGLRKITRSHLEAARGKGTLCSPFAQALGFSRNAVYAQLATQKLMRSDLVEIGEAFGFNHPLPFDATARLGSLEVPYNDLDFARAAAGFIGSRLSVLGAAQLALTVANAGRVRSISLQSKSAAETPLPRRIYGEHTAQWLRRMMEVTVHSGTSLSAFSDERGRSYLGSIRVAGKTGTLKPTSNSPTASWFVGFAPSRKPKVVVSVLLQNPDKWYRKGNQVGRDLLRYYFSHAGARGVKSPL